MTIVSTAAEPSEFDFPLEEVTPLDKGEGSLDLELKSFPPLDDAIDKVKAIDWELVRVRAILVVNGLGAALSMLGRGVYTIGEELKKV